MRVALAEDNPPFRRGLTLLLEALDIEVVLAVGDGPALVAGIQDNPPDVAMLDARMPPSGDGEGFRTAEKIRRQHPDVGILLFSDYTFYAYAQRLLEQIPNRVGYLVKDRVREDEVLKDAIIRIAAGEVVLDDIIAQRISDAAPEDLLPIEHEVLRHVASGLSNHAVARAMFIGEPTVERHLTSIFRKLNLPSDRDHNRRVLAILRWREAQRN